MSASTGKNAIANLLGSLVGPLVGIVMTPFYLRKIGLEGLGLIGLMVLITTVLGVFIAGASKTYQRDVATAQTSAPEDLSGLIKGGMFLFVAIGAVLGAVVLFFGHTQIRELAAGTRISGSTIDRCLILISALLTLGVTSGALSATLIALRDQVWPNICAIIIMILNAFVIWHALDRWPRVDVFYLCQLGGSTLLTICLALRCALVIQQNSTGIPSRRVWDAWRDKIKGSGRLSFMLMVHEGLGLLITQIDRFLVTSQFPLTSLGAYNLGANPSRLVAMLTAPITTAIYPELCSAANSNISRKVIGEYLGRVTFLLVLLLGSGMIVILPCAGDLLQVWLGSGNIPPETARCFILLSLGHFLLAMAGPYYNLTVAFGDVRYGIPKNLISLLVLPIIGYASLKMFGLPGIALVPIIYGLISIAICGYICFSRYADSRSSARWIIADIFALSTASIIMIILKFLHFGGWTNISVACVCSATFLLAFLLTYVGRSPRHWWNLLELAPPLQPVERS